MFLTLPEAERRAFAVAFAFLKDRLSCQETIEWALRLEPHESTKRMAISSLLDATPTIGDPWYSAWRLLEQSWASPEEHQDRLSQKRYLIEERIKRAERSQSLVSEIVNLVRPLIHLSSSTSDSHEKKRRRHPKTVSDIINVTFSSGEIVSPDELGFSTIDDRSFLFDLSYQLDSAISNSLGLGKYLGWELDYNNWRFGWVHRVYYVNASDRDPEDHEPDEFHKGIAPAVKLLYAAVARLCELDATYAHSLLNKWKSGPAIYRRLWAAVARNSTIISADEVGLFLLNCGWQEFWDLHSFPEISELRARRFGDLKKSDQRLILSKIMKGPPRRFWNAKIDEKKLRQLRHHSIARELRRVELLYPFLPEHITLWRQSHVEEFENFRQIQRIDEGFPGNRRAYSVPPNPDSSYALLSGDARLSALEGALSSGKSSWNDDTTQRALDWIRESGNVEKVLVDFERCSQLNAYPLVLEKFSWKYTPIQPEGPEESQSSKFMEQQGFRVLAVFQRLNSETALAAIQGVSFWIDSWSRYIAELPQAREVWLRLWPVAAQATNDQGSEGGEDDELSLDVAAREFNAKEPRDLDTLNTPAGRLVGAFLTFISRPSFREHPFENSDFRLMRDALLAYGGRASLIARHRMIEWLGWFLRIDSQWTHSALIDPLREDTPQGLALWRAVARRRQSAETIDLIGELMVARAVSSKLGRESRQSLAFSLVVEILFSYLENRAPGVTHAHIQQMLRSLDDEVRAHAANAVQRFVKDLSTSAEPIAKPEELFERAAKPFLEYVWPQERSLATPGVARALADLPASCGEAFAEAVDAIERFLVPFQCWSLIEYGLYGQEAGVKKLHKINDEPKAEGLLRLFDATIGTSEDATVPHNLGDVLEHIQLVAPQLVETQRFRRLAALGRR